MTLLEMGIALPWLIVSLFIGLGCWIGFQLIHQNGRILSRLEALEQRAAAAVPAGLVTGGVAPEMALPDPVYGRILVRLEALEQQLEQAAPAEDPGPPPGLPLGSPAPEFDLPDLSSNRQALSQFRGRDLLLIFFNPGCGFCTEMAPDLAALPVDGSAGRPLPLVVSTGTAEANRQLAEEHGIRCPVLLQAAMEVASRYQCNGTPMGYRIDAQGNIASEMAVGAQALLALAAAPSPGANGRAPLGGKRELSESKIERNGLAVGTPAPGFRLPLLHGGELSLSEYRGREVLLVFSDPHCGPCDQLTPQLERQSRRTARVQVLMVSRGDEEANRAKAAEHGLTFPVVLQRQWEISRDYAMFGTPVGYLIDEAGTIAAEAAVGVEPILALLSRPALPVNGREKLPRHGRKQAASRR